MSSTKTLQRMAIAIGLIYLFVAIPLPAQVVDLNPIPPFPKKAAHRMTGVLSELVDRFENRGPAEAGDFAKKRGLEFGAGRVRVVAEMQSEASAKGLRLPGAAIEGAYRNLVQMSVPLGAVKGLSNMPGVKIVREPLKPIPLEITSEGVAPTGAPAWHSSGFTGQGAKVAILDCTGFAGYEELLGTELPDNVVTKSFRLSDYDIKAGGNHGTGCAELVHDMAPGAELYLVNYDHVAGMYMGVDWLKGNGVDIITHSVGWVNVGPYDGTGGICQIVNDAHAAGILWTNSIGNETEWHWEGDFTDKDRDSWHGFSRKDETLTITAEAGDMIAVFLSWNDWGPLWPLLSGASNDYDLYLLDAGLNIVAASENWQSGSEHPTEEIVYEVSTPGTYHIVVRNYDATGDHYLEIYSFYHKLEYHVSESSLVIPADATGAMATGAAYWNDKSLEYFSSLGPPDVPGGGPPDYSFAVYKPELLGPDGVSTVTYGTGDFYGTSSSSPHVAGAAALLLSYPEYSGAGPDQLRSILAQNAENYGYGALPDWKHGYGFLTMPSLEPDLTLSSDGIAFNNSSPTDGEDVIITAMIHNAGLAGASGVLVSFYDGALAPETKIGNNTIPAIAAGGTGVASINWTASGAGNHDIYVVADPDSTIAESDENNNQAFKTITVGSSEPDAIMYVSDIAMSSGSRRRGKNTFWQVSATVHVESNGTPVSEATVDGTWSGKYSGSVSGTTSGDGTVVFITDWVKNGGTFTFTVDNVLKDGLTYDPNRNTETSDSINTSSAPALAKSYPTELGNPFPSPSNPEVWIPFSLASPEHVVIKIYDSTGRLVGKLDLGQKIPGAYVSKGEAAYWDGRTRNGEKVTSGIYFYVMEAGSFRAMKKMVILK